MIRNPQISDEVFALEQHFARDFLKLFHSGQTITAFHEPLLCRFSTISPLACQLTGEDYLFVHFASASGRS